MPASIPMSEAYGNSVPGNFLTQNDRALVIQANHVKRVFAGIDTDCADNCDCLFCKAWHLLLVLQNSRTDSVGRSGQEHGRSIPFASIHLDASIRAQSEA